MEGTTHTIHSKIISTFILISFALSILSFSNAPSSESRISCGGANVIWNAGTNSTHWTFTVMSTGGGNVMTNSTYLAVWNDQGKLIIAPATLDKFESQSSIDSRVQYFDYYSPYGLSIGETLAFNRSAFPSGLTMKLLMVTINAEEWYTIGQKSIGDANPLQLDPLPPVPSDYTPQILAIVLVGIAAISILFVFVRWDKILDKMNSDVRMSKIIKWMPLAFLIAGILILCLGFYEFPSPSPLEFDRFPKQEQLYSAIFLIAPTLCGTATALEYSKWHQKLIASKWIFLSYLVVSIAILILSLNSLGVMLEGYGLPSC